MLKVKDKNNYYDVYSYGMISASTLHILKNSFPAPDNYAEISDTYAMTGGEALNSSIVLSRLGIHTFLDGNWIGDNAAGLNLLERLKLYNIDTSRLVVKKGFPGVNEVVFSDNKTRTVFGNYIDLLFTYRKWNIPKKKDISRAKIVCLDPFFGHQSEQAADYAQELGIPYVTVDCPFDKIISAGAAVNILSGEFRKREYPQVDLLKLFSEYQNNTAGLVVFTQGSRETIYARKGETVKHHKSYPVTVIDSAGAGDSFRSGIIYGMLKGFNDSEMIRYASALAAMICQSFPGVLNSPSHRNVIRFINEHEKNINPV